MYPAACCIAPSPRFTAASDFRVGRRGKKKIMAQEGEEAMTLDSALQELGMLSQASPLRSEYLNERERIKIGQGCIRPLYRVPCSSPQPDPSSESGTSSPLPLACLFSNRTVNPASGKSAPDRCSGGKK